MGSCQKSLFDAPTEEHLSLVQQALRELVTENGYLVFKDTAHYQRVLEQISKMDETEMKEFSGKLSIVSKRQKMNEALNAYALSSETDNLKAEFKKELRFDAEGNYNGFAFPLYNRAAVLNEMGMVKVGKEIHVFTNDRFIALRDGDINKLKTLPTTGDEMVNQNNLFISKLHRENNHSVNPNLLEVRTYGSFVSDFARLTRSPNDRYYLLYPDYTWFETAVGPIPLTTFKNFEFNIHGMSFIIIRNRPRVNFDERSIGVNYFAAGCTIASHSEQIADLTRGIGSQLVISGTGWSFDRTLITGNMLSVRGLFTGRFNWRGAFHASLEYNLQNQWAPVFTFNRNEKFPQ